MHHAREWKRSHWLYALPIAGAVMMLVRRGHKEHREGNAQESLLDETNLGLTQALNVALRYVPGTPIEVELEQEHGMPVWDVEIVPRKGGPTREVLVDARTGDVLEMRAEYPDEKK